MESHAAAQRPRRRVQLDRRCRRRSPPARRPVEHTFAAPGVYTFLCDVHGAAMTGTVTVEDPGADPLENVLVFSKTAGFRHDSIPAGITAIQELGAANDFAVDATEDAAAVHRRQPRAVRRGRLPLHDQRRPQRRAAGRVRALHPQRRRLRRHPRRGRHRVHVAVVRRDARRLLPQPPRRNPTGDRPHRGRGRALHAGTPDRLEPRRTSGTTTNPSTNPVRQRRRCRLLGPATAASRSSPPWTSRPTTRTTAATARTTTTRSRGARTSTAATSCTRASATPRSRSAPARQHPLAHPRRPGDRHRRRAVRLR